MEEALIDQDIALEKTGDQNRKLDELVSESDLASFMSDEAFSELDRDQQIEALSLFLEQKRIAAGFPIPAFENLPETDRAEAYRNWDQEQAKNAISFKQMREIMPEPKSDEPAESIVEVDPLAETQKVNMPELMAQAEMEIIMPVAETRTSVERYSDLVVKAEAKAREYEQKVTLTPAETKRLEEIRADIAYFSEKMKAAIAVEQEKAPIQKIKTPIATEAAPENRTPAAVREELIKLNKPAVEPVLETANLERIDTVKITEAPPKKSLWSRFVGNFKLDQETPVKSSEPAPQTPKEKILNNPPLKKVDSINSGIRVD